MKKSLSLISLSLLLTACGNPHLASPESQQMVNAIDQIRSGQIAIDNMVNGTNMKVELDVRPLIINELGKVDEEKTKSNTKLDEISLEAENKNSANQKLLITNLSMDEVTLDFNLEKGKYFSKEFNGQEIKELPPVCDKTLSSGKTCYLDINFTSAVDGHFKDKLTIDFRGVHFKDKEGQKIVSLSADRSSENEDDDPNMNVKAWIPSGFLKLGKKNYADFGTVKEGEEKTVRIKIKNVGKEHVGFIAKMKFGKNFEFSGGKFPGKDGTCKEEKDGYVILPKHHKCWVEIEFVGTEPGLYNDDLQVFYQDKDQQKTLNLTINLLGERIKGE